ncbi:unnamed protein product [Rhizopus stolonifer]
MSTPRFWQKFGLVKQTKTSSDKKNRMSFIASPPFNVIEKSGTLRHRASSASLQIMAESQLKRVTTYELKTEETCKRKNPRKSLESNSKIPSRLKKSKSNQSIQSSTSNGSKRQPSPARLRLSHSASSASISKKKSLTQLANDRPECTDTHDLLATVKSLKEELEKEKALSRSLQGQKEAISKDLDYFCTLSDEITEERDQLKLENEQLRRTIQEQRSGNQQDNKWKEKLENMRRQTVEEQYAYNNNLQYKKDEISKLKIDLKEAHCQMQVLRNTMEQMLKADGKDFEKLQKKTVYDAPMDLLLQKEYHSIYSEKETDEDLSVSDDYQPFDFLKYTDDEDSDYKKVNQKPFKYSISFFTASYKVS